MTPIKENKLAMQSISKNRRVGKYVKNLALGFPCLNSTDKFSFSDALFTALSALYAKLIVVLGIAFPVTDVISHRAPASFYQGFYMILYAVSISFVIYMYAVHVRSRAVFTLIDTFGNFERHNFIT